MTRCYIGLGSNLQNPREQILSAFAALKQLPNSTLVASSSLFGSKAIGPGKQDDYVNAVAALDTELEAQTLLRELQQLESHFGRERHVHWGPRTLDLDLLLYGDEQYDSPELHLPHPRLCQREFVLSPLAAPSPH